MDAQWESDKANPLRKFAFYFALATIYIRFSMIHEVLASVLHINLYLLYLIMPPAILGVLITGGIQRSVQSKVSKYWLTFVVLLFVSVPFSIWKGDSVANVYKYVKAEFIMLFIIAGVVMTWEECKLVINVLVLAAVSDLAIGRIFMREGLDRTDLDLGGSTIANSNDMAVHLILMTAFLLYMVIAPSMPKLFKLAGLPAIGYTLFLILKSGSRGAVIALIACAIFLFVMGSSRFRIVLLVATPVAVVLLIASLPRSTLERLSTITSETSDVTVQGDAEGSSEARRELLKTSLIATITHPIFGIGPGEFYNYEGGSSVKEGKRGLWHGTHNSFTQISSECGIPAALFYIAALVASFRLLLNTNRRARANPANADIAAVTFCMMLAFVGFCTGIFFVNFGYFFYEPALCALCVVIHGAARREMDARDYRTATKPAAAPLWAPAQPFPAPAFASKFL